MSNETSSQLENIYSMMSSGHRCIRMERRSLILWGVTGGILCIVTDILFQREKFASNELFLAAVQLFLIIVLSGVALVDFHCTRRRKQAMGETLPFVHAQITKVWWLFLTMGVLFDLGSSYFGGSYMSFGVWMFLVGLGLFVHGLFSEQMLEYAGVLIILLGIVPLTLKVHYEFTRWLAASVFGLGFPALTLLLDGGKTRGFSRRLLQSFCWLLFVLAPPLAAKHYLNRYDVPAVSTAPVVSLQGFLGQAVVANPQVVTLPAGSRVPVKFAITGNIFRNEDATLPLILSRPVEIIVENGRPSGYFRFAGERWKYYKRYLFMEARDMKSEVTKSEGGPVTKIGCKISAED